MIKNMSDLITEIDKIITQIPKESGINQLWLDTKMYKEFEKTEYKGFSINTHPLIKDGLIYAGNYSFKYQPIEV